MKVTNSLLFASLLIIVLSLSSCAFANKAVSYESEEEMSKLGVFDVVLADNKTATNATATQPPPPPSTVSGAPLAFNIVTIVFSVCIVIFALGLTFFGYKLFKLMMAIFGFVIGTILGFFLFLLIFQTFGASGDWVWWTALAIGVVIGIIFAILSFFFYLVGVFFVGGAIGLTLAFLMNVALYQYVFEDSPEWAKWTFYITSAVFFVLTGLIALKLQKFMIVLGTSFGGGYLVVFSVNSWIPTKSVAGKSWYEWVLFSALVILGIAGCLVQFSITSRGRSKFSHTNDDGEYEPLYK